MFTFRLLVTLGLGWCVGGGPLDAQVTPEGWQELFGSSAPAPDLGALGYTPCGDVTTRSASVRGGLFEGPVGFRFAISAQGEATTETVGLPASAEPYRVRFLGIYCRGRSEVVVLVESYRGRALLLERGAIDPASDEGVLLLRDGDRNPLRRARLREADGAWSAVPDPVLPLDQPLFVVGRRAHFRPSSHGVRLEGNVAQIVGGADPSVPCPVIASPTESDGPDVPLYAISALTTLVLEIGSDWIEIDLEEALASLPSGCRG